VGLRPGRTVLRLDSEVVSRATAQPPEEKPSEELLVVHCYGLGGSGFTLGRGLAEDVVSNHIVPFLSLPSIERKTEMRQG
jgi:hypothetical protein